MAELFVKSLRKRLPTKAGIWVSGFQVMALDAVPVEIPEGIRHFSKVRLPYYYMVSLIYTLQSKMTGFAGTPAHAGSFYRGSDFFI
jgi:hypothetical protein